MDAGLRLDEPPHELWWRSGTTRPTLAGRQIVAAALERVEDVAGDKLSVSTVVPTGVASHTDVPVISASYELGLLPPDFETGWVERWEHALAELGEAWQEKLPDIRVETRLLHAHPVPALVDASHNSEHLVLLR